MKISLYTLILPRIELPFLEEWIHHNLSLGVDEIFIYNNGFSSIDSFSPKNCDEKDYKWTKKPDVEYNENLSDEQINTEINIIQSKYIGKVNFKSWAYKEDHEDEYPKSQVTGYKHCAENNPSDYWLFCDPDEFFVLQKHKTFQDLIEDDEMKDVGAFWFGPEFYEPRVNNKSTNELKTSGEYRMPRGNWKHTRCMSKSLVKTPIKWAYKFDSIIHKNRSTAGYSKHINKDIGYFKHYTTTR
jgi:hypothetical protein